MFIVNQLIEVGFDVSALSSGHRFRGIGGYTKQLTEALQSLSLPDLEIKLLKSGEQCLDCDLIHYPFFDDVQHEGADAIFGLDIPLMRLVNLFKSAAMQYGTEKRVLLLHGPVGSAKSTIVRLLKRGLEDYSRTPEGALYSYSWINLAEEEEELQTIRRQIECLPPQSAPDNDT